jgi:hypothetical protein
MAEWLDDQPDWWQSEATEKEEQLSLAEQAARGEDQEVRKPLMTSTSISSILLEVGNAPLLLDAEVKREKL